MARESNIFADMMKSKETVSTSVLLSTLMQAVVRVVEHNEEISTKNICIELQRLFSVNVDMQTLGSILFRMKNGNILNVQSVSQYNGGKKGGNINLYSLSDIGEYKLWLAKNFAEEVIKRTIVPGEVPPVSFSEISPKKTMIATILYKRKPTLVKDIPCLLHGKFQTVRTENREIPAVLKSMRRKNYVIASPVGDKKLNEYSLSSLGGEFLFSSVQFYKRMLA